MTLQLLSILVKHHITNKIISVDRVDSGQLHRNSFINDFERSLVNLIEGG